jgi:hypothetical protein
MNPLTCHLQDRHSKLLGWVFVILIASYFLLSGCTSMKQAVQTDPSAILRKPESNHEVHGEVGVM